MLSAETLRAPARSGTGQVRRGLRVGPFHLVATGEELDFGCPARERAYEDFLVPEGMGSRGAGRSLAPGGARPDFRIEVSPGPLPGLDLAGLEVVHRSRGQWWLARDREGRTLLPFCIPAGAPGLARLLSPDDDFRSGVLRVDPSLERPAPTPRPGAGPGPINPFGNLLSELLVTCLLEQRPGLLLHAAAVMDRGRALVFPGASGAGKTTLAKLWLDRAARDEGSGIRVLGDESVLLTLEGDSILVHGTPWQSAEPLCARASAPLAAVFFPEHGDENASRGMSRADAFCGILAQALAPFWSERGAENAMDAAARVVEAVPCERLAFRPTPEVVRFLEARP